MSFHIGQKVVCVDDRGWSRFVQNLPVAGVVYTIRGIQVNAYTASGFFLEEIANPPYQTDYGLREPSFYSWRFRPVVERKTDISVFTELLREREEVG